MDKRIKALWTGALRGGQYQQGQQALRTIEDGKTKDCCLGVLCDLYRIEHPEEAEWGPDGAFVLKLDDGGEREFEEVLPDTVAAWADLGETDPVMGTAPASQHNDGYRQDEGNVPPKTFAEIADLIDQHL